MSRYLLLFLLNLPFILAALLSAVTQYKLGRSSSRRLFLQVTIWIIVLAGLALAEPIYVWLFNNNLTTTEPLSLFDVVQITAIVITFYIANRSRLKTQTLERRVQDLHQELSIRLSQKDR
jgi:hypothetical protein